MATNFPTSADDATTLPNPSATDKTNSPDHASLHGNGNDAIKALEAKLGAGSSTPANNTFLIGNGSGTSAFSSLTSAQLSARLSDETGTGLAVFGTTPTLVTPKADTINESTPANGVTIDGLNLKDGVLNTNNSVVTSNITDAAITPAKLVTGAGTSWAWQSYTPVFTNATTGNGTVSGKYTQIGKTVFFNSRFLFGSTSSFSGTLSCTLPVTSVSYTTAYTKVIGHVSIYDTSASAQYNGVAAWTSTTNFEPDCQIVATYVKANGINGTIPITFANGDVLDCHGFYEVP
jgi:hypothetical protein